VTPQDLAAVAGGPRGSPAGHQQPGSDGWPLASSCNPRTAALVNPALVRAGCRRPDHDGDTGTSPVPRRSAPLPYVDHRSRSSPVRRERRGLESDPERTHDSPHAILLRSRSVRDPATRSPNEAPFRGRCESEGCSDQCFELTRPVGSLGRRKRAAFCRRSTRAGPAMVVSRPNKGRWQGGRLRRPPRSRVRFGSDRARRGCTAACGRP